MASIILFIPLIESITEVICGYIELLKIQSTKAVLKGNNEIAKLQQESEKENTEVCSNVIGFQYNPQEDLYDFDDD
jgi:hypothetical protein